MTDDREDTELPQPGLDEEDQSHSEGTHPTDGPGGVSVDEPTGPALNPEDGDADSQQDE
jgi:hypothetical protein